MIWLVKIRLILQFQEVGFWVDFEVRVDVGVDVGVDIGVDVGVIVGDDVEIRVANF